MTEIRCLQVRKWSASPALTSLPVNSCLNDKTSGFYEMICGREWAPSFAKLFQLLVISHMWNWSCVKYFCSDLWSPCSQWLSLYPSIKFNFSLLQFSSPPQKCVFSGISLWQILVGPLTRSLENWFSKVLILLMVLFWTPSVLTPSLLHYPAEIWTFSWATP